MYEVLINACIERWVPITREITSASLPTTTRRRTSTTFRRSRRFMTRAIISPAANTCLVHLQNRFRVVRYSSRHESSNLCTFVFG